jgi:hypothetical protein
LLAMIAIFFFVFVSDIVDLLYISKLAIIELMNNIHIDCFFVNRPCGLPGGAARGIFCIFCVMVYV